MHDPAREHATEIIQALRVFARDTRELMDAIADRSFIPREEVMELQAKLKDLKGRLKQAAKRGTVDGSRRPLTHQESAFFQPAVQSAAVNCSVAVNTHPIKSNWFSDLYGMEIDIQHLLGQLEDAYPDA